MCRCLLIIILFWFHPWTWSCPLFNLFYSLCFFADFLRSVRWINVLGIYLCQWILIIIIILNCCWLFCSHQKWANTDKPSPLLISATIIRILGVFFFLFNFFLILGPVIAFLDVGFIEVSKLPLHFCVVMCFNGVGDVD